jgi:hypothetical protein
MRKPSLFNFLLAVLLSAGIGCGSDNDQTSQVRVFHASPDAPNVDVLINGGRVLENVPYSTASDFLEVDAGHSQFTITPAGDTTRVIDTRADLIPDTSYLVIASGKVSAIAPIIAQVDRAAVPSDSAKIRVLHTAPSAPNVDVYVLAPAGSLQDAEPVLANVPFGAVSQYLTVPAGSYDVYVTPAGSKSVAIEAKGLNLPGGFQGSVAALDAKGGGSPFALQVLDESSK